MDPSRLDLGHLALFVGYAFADAVQAKLAEQGYGDARFSHGFVFQHLVEGGRPISELAARLGVSQQAASKSVAELEALGFVARAPGEADARQRVVELTARGRAVVHAARRARKGIVARLERAHGRTTLARCRVALREVLETLGGTEAVKRRRVVAPR